ncbi:hypothetical protein HOK31_19775, partial [Candidatus Poribacteria bacterium]|nr:hypothetical protein [Candidatus Poribacteria bacterium]
MARSLVPCLIAAAALLTACGGDSTDTPLDDETAGSTSVQPDDPLGNGQSDLDPVAAVGGRIAFEVGDIGNTDIFVMDADGGNLTNITNEAGADYDPAWSPDGSQLAFASDRNADDNIYVMDADGGNATNITNHGGADMAPSWSPNGSRIAFMRAENVENDIYLMDA